MTMPATSSTPGMKRAVLIWAGLLLLVAAEVGVTYARLGTAAQLVLLLLLAFLEAGIALMYFMHLRYERRILFWSLIPPLLFALVMLDQIWPDAHRLLRLRVGGP